MTRTRFELPHDTCMGFDVPSRDGRVGRTYHADPRNKGSVVIDDPRDAALAKQSLAGGYSREEGSAVFMHDAERSDKAAATTVCRTCSFERWAWTASCPRCHTSDG